MSDSTSDSNTTWTKATSATGGVIQKWLAFRALAPGCELIKVMALDNMEAVLELP